MNGNSRSEKVSTATFVVMCVAVAIAAINQVVLSRSRPPSPPRPQPIADGTKLELPASLTADGQTPALLLVLSTTCRYCTASMPFYARLSSLPEVTSGRVRLTVVSLQTPPQMREYLEKHGLAIDAIVTTIESGFSVPGTPTIVLADARGVVTASWSGQLPGEEEERVVSAIARLSR